MKKVVGLILALMLLIPVGLYAQVEAAAGSITIGVHFDAAFRYSGKDENKVWRDIDDDGTLDQEDWNGYETFNGEALILALSGKIGDKVNWRFQEAFVLPYYLNSGMSGVYPSTLGELDHPVTLEACAQWKPIDQLGITIGRVLVPTAIANVPHMLKVHHMANPPLIITGGFNGKLNSLPTYQTGVALDVNFAGINLNYMLYNGELEGQDFTFGGSDLAIDVDKSKGGNVALTYNGDVGPGKLTARAFYFQEYSDITDDLAAGLGVDDDASISGWGIGVMYNADNYFGGVEYITNTLDPEDPDNPATPNIDESETQTGYGYYVLLGGRFSSIEFAFRYDFIDWSDLDAHKDKDTETWYNIALSYLINDNATIGIGYTIKQPEKPDDDTATPVDESEIPNIDELQVFLELDLL